MAVQGMANAARSGAQALDILSGFLLVDLVEASAPESSSISAANTVEQHDRNLDWFEWIEALA